MKKQAAKTSRPQGRMRVAAIQFESCPRDKEANFVVLEKFIRQAARRGVELIVFPECCLTGYWFIRNLTTSQLQELAEPIFTGPSSKRLLYLAKQYRMTIGAGLVEVAPRG